MKLRSLSGQTVKSPAEVPVAAKNDSAPAATGSNTYIVKSGDTLAKISRKTGTSATALAKFNGIKDPARLSIGQKLKLPGSSTAPAKESPAAPASAPASKETYIVRNGDTFYSIARKHKISAESLAAANPGIKASELRTGQLINLHGKAPSVANTAKPAAETTVANRPAAAKAPEHKAVPETAPAPPIPSETPVAKAPAPAPSPATPATPAPNPQPAAKTQVHSVVIDSEMTYGEFAAKHGTKIERLNELNGLDLAQATVLAKGSELYVSAQP